MKLKFIGWSEKEDSILAKVRSLHFHSSHKSALLEVKKALKVNGFNRTIKAIERRSWRLGIKNHTPNDPLIETKCNSCGKKIVVRLRHKERSKRCVECQKVRNRKYDRENREKIRKYGHEYYVTFIKNPRIPLRTKKSSEIFMSSTSFLHGF